jgi:hypothetical protein
MRMRITRYPGARAGVFAADGADLGLGTVRTVEGDDDAVVLDSHPDIAITARLDRLWVLATIEEQIAHAQAAAYVWGRQDAGQNARDTGDSLAFAAAFEERRRAFDQGRSVFMPSLQSAFREWRETGEIALRHTPDPAQQ